MKSESLSLNVFVYGTLKPGGANYAFYCQGKTSSEILSYVRGDLYNLPQGYPAMTEGSNKVWGVMLSFGDPQVLNRLDELEDYQAPREPKLNLYNRQLTMVYDNSDRQIGRAWAYFMTVEKVDCYQGSEIPSGNWVGRKQRSTVDL